MKIIKIAIIDDHPVLRKALISLFNEYENINVVFETGNGQEVLSLTKTHEPDVILLDVEMPIMNGKEVLISLKKEFSEIKVIMLSTHYSDQFILGFISLGARGYISKGSEFNEIIEAINSVYCQGYFFDAKVSPALVKKCLGEDLSNSYYLDSILSLREIEILKLFCAESTSEEIAHKLEISKRTVEWHKENIYAKTGAKNVAGLVIYAVKHKIITII
jgi:DNA-binding NarL/FixJ family response regulator